MKFIINYQRLSIAIYYSFCRILATFNRDLRQEFGNSRGGQNQVPFFVDSAKTVHSGNGFTVPPLDFILARNTEGYIEKDIHTATGRIKAWDKGSG